MKLLMYVNPAHLVEKGTKRHNQFVLQREGYKQCVRFEIKDFAGPEEYAKHFLLAFGKIEEETSVINFHKKQLKKWMETLNITIQNQLKKLFHRPKTK